MTDEQKKKLEQKLWDIANTLRGKMNADEFRDYILGFIFFKYLSERMHLYANDVLKQDNIDYLSVNETTADGKAILDAVSEASVDALGYFLRPSELFSQIAKRGSKPGQFILADLTAILNNIQRSTMGTESEDDFDNLFEDLDLTSTKLGRTEEAKNTLIARVLTHLDEIDFQLDQANSDVLGDAYEYLIGQFASGAGKKAGEFYTPQQVSTILARIVTTGRTRLKSVYDPACGSGSLLLRVAKEADVSEFFGQEMNRTTYNLARMNMILHGVHYRHFDLKQEDTLEHPQHDGMRFDAVVANPPFSADWSSSPLLLTDDRFSQYGRLAPASKADFAFVQHMLHHLDDNGTMAVILPHGALFRGGAEGHIRQYLIKDRNWLDAVIGLPPNIFYGTTIPTCIMVFKKCRETEDVLFIDAASCFEKAKNQNFLRNSDVDRIVSAYRGRIAEDRFSRRATRAEIEENDYNLNIPRYVDTFDEEAEISLEDVHERSKAAHQQLLEAELAISLFCKELGILPPVGANLLALQNFKAWLMQKLFSKQLRFSRDNGQAFPDWQQKRLGEVFTWVKTNSLSREFLTHHGGNVQNIHYGDIHTKFRPLFRQSAEIVPFVGSNSTLKPFSDEEYCRVGDVVIADASEDYADIGKAIEIVEVRERSLVAGLHTYIARPKIGCLVVGFSGYLLRSAPMRRQIMRIAQGISVLGISKGNLEKLTFWVPHTDEQRKIAATLSAIDSKIQSISGQIRPQDPDVEKS
ncbi:MAG TPA: type I restriction-modification system subunit M [Hyphomonadaceae bacterium]|nr:type I restriction-modification system subunit M [Hyphomonadaceae bacterium]